MRPGPSEAGCFDRSAAGANPFGGAWLYRGPMTRLALVCLLVGSAAVACASASHEGAPAQKPQAVSVALAARRPFPVVYRVSGTVRGTSTATLSSKATGAIRSVAVRAGDSVRAGQVLAELEASDVRAGVARARAAVATATAARLESQNALEGARANARLSQSTHERSQALLGQQVISQAEFDASEASFKSASAQAEMAQARVQVATSSLAEAEAALQESQSLLGYTKVTAPFTGRVLERLVDPGALASPGMPLLVLSEDDRLRVETSVSESQLPGLELGDSAQIDLQGHAQPLTGAVSEIVPNVDPASRAFVVKLDLPPLSPSPRPGSFARVEFTLAAEPRLVVASAAISRFGALDRVFVVEDGKARLRMVTLGEAAAGVTQVLSGLAEGEPVVLSPASELRDGSVVQVTP